MLINLLREALEARHLLAFSYDGLNRIVEPHALGLNKRGELVLRAYQVAGDSASNSEGWKLFVLERAEAMTVIVSESQAPRPGYKTGDRAMVEILAELPQPAPAEMEAAA